MGIFLQVQWFRFWHPSQEYESKIIAILILFKTLDGLKSFIDGHSPLRDSKLKFLVMGKILQELKLKKKTTSSLRRKILSRY